MTRKEINQVIQRFKKELGRFDDIIQNEKEYDDDDTKKIQRSLNKIFKSTKDTDLQLSGVANIVYEMQAIIYWLDGKSDKAIEFAKKAKAVNDNQPLYTHAAKNLLEKHTNKAKKATRLTELKLWILNHKKIIIITMAILGVTMATLLVISNSFKTSGNALVQKADFYSKSIKSVYLGSVYLTSRENENENLNKALQIYKEALTNYQNSRKFSPFFVSSSDVTDIEGKINSINASLELNKKFDLIDTEMNTSDLASAQKQSYAAIDYAQSNKISSARAYWYLANALIQQQQRGDSADDIIYALNKSYDNKLNKTIPQIISDDVDFNYTGVTPDILVMYGAALEVSNKDTEAITALNYAIGSMSDMKSSSYKKSLMAESYYYLSVAYCRTKNYTKSLENINSSLANDPTNESAITYKNIITSLQ